MATGKITKLIKVKTVDANFANSQRAFLSSYISADKFIVGVNSTSGYVLVPFKGSLGWGLWSVTGVIPDTIQNIDIAYMDT